MYKYRDNDPNLFLRLLFLTDIWISCLILYRSTFIVYHRDPGWIFRELKYILMLLFFGKLFIVSVIFPAESLTSQKKKTTYWTLKQNKTKQKTNQNKNLCVDFDSFDLFVSLPSYDIHLISY